MHRPVIRLTSSLTFLILALSIPASAAVIPVEGLNDPATDRITLQEAIDGAQPGDTLLLSGIFQLDGERILITTTPLTLQGVILDNDGDGQANEDWLDGIDNDGDGEVDEDGWDAVIRGVTNPDGTPAQGSDPTGYFNRGLALQGVTGTVEGLTIRGLKFENHVRAVTFEPDIDSTSNRCEESRVTGGSAVDLDLRHNFFTGNVRGVQALGEVDDLRIHRNLFLENQAVDLLIVGGVRSCSGGTGPLPLGTPTNTEITRNRILASNIGVFTDRTEDLSFKGNTIDRVVLGVFTRLDRGIQIQGNDISRSLRAVTTSLPATDANIFDNRISQVLTVGILLQNGSTGYLVNTNHFDGSGQADIQLAANTSDNVVIALPGDRVIDQGTGNQVVIRGNGNVK